MLRVNIGQRSSLRLVKNVKGVALALGLAVTGAAAPPASASTSQALTARSAIAATAGGKSMGPKASQPAVIGQPCPAGARRNDVSGRPSSCLNTSVAGRVWVWSSPIPTVVTDLSVPGSWSGVSIDESGLSAPNQSPPLSSNYQSRYDMESALINEVNSWRQGLGLAPLAHDPRLSHLSKFWAERFDDPQFQGRGTSHCPGSICALRANELGYMSFGEVIRPFTPVPKGDVSGERFFIDSPPHYAILTGNYTHIGFAFHPVAGPDGRPRGFVVVGQTARSRS
jgi:Cysteine-rich secretory protein family